MMNTVPDKQQRHLAIKRIIAERTITTQSELVSAMRKLGFRTTQATLSRDMQEIGVSWITTPEGAQYTLNPDHEEGQLSMLVGLEIQDIVANEVLILVKTLPGRAQGVAEIIDHLQIPGVLGTIAGDNTVLVLPRSVPRIKETIKSLREILRRKPVPKAP
jgi:transcriptional regulator of arginine metabolism